jgi:hypothetical protein
VHYRSNDCGLASVLELIKAQKGSKVPCHRIAVPKSKAVRSTDFPQILFNL